MIIYYHSNEKLLLYTRFKSPCKGQIGKVVSYLPNVIFYHFPAWPNMKFLLTAHWVDYLPLHSCSHSIAHIHLPFILVWLCQWKNFQPIEKFYKGLLEPNCWVPAQKQNLQIEKMKSIGCRLLGMGESKAGKSLGLDRKQNGETHVSFTSAGMR